jgi:hypothetical protein
MQSEIPNINPEGSLKELQFICEVRVKSLKQLYYKTIQLRNDTYNKDISYTYLERLADKLTAKSKEGKQLREEITRLLKEILYGVGGCDEKENSNICEDKTESAETNE